MSSEQQHLAELLAAIESLPPNVNPYQFALAQLQLKITPEMPDYIVPLLYVMIGLASIGLVLGLISLISKAFYSALWVVRKRHTPMGAVITTNTTTLLAILNCIHFVGAIIAETLMARTFADKKNPTPWQGLQPVLWLPVALSAWTEATGTSLATLLSKTGRSSRSSSMLNRLPKVRRARWHAWQVNLIVALGYITVPAVTIPLFTIGAIKLQDAWNALQDIKAAVAPAASAWQEGDAFQFSPALLPLVERFSTKGDQALDHIGQGFLAMISLILAAALAYIPAVWVYVRMLRRQLQSYVHSVTSSNAGVEEKHKRNRMIHLRNTYRLMIAESVIVLILNTVFFFVGGTAGAWPRLIITNGTNLAMIFSIALLSYGIAGTMLNLILAWRALQPLIVRTKGPKTFAEAIAVETVVQRFMDGDETQEDDQADKVELSQGRKEVLSFAAVEHDDDLEKKERIGNDHPFNFAAVPPMNTAQAY